MPLEESEKLFLKRSFSMMLGLRGNVGNRVLHLRNADAEGSISFLPCKGVVFEKRVVDPFRRAALNELNCLRERNGGGQRKQSFPSDKSLGYFRASLRDEGNNTPRMLNSTPRVFRDILYMFRRHPFAFFASWR